MSLIETEDFLSLLIVIPVITIIAALLDQDLHFLTKYVFTNDQIPSLLIS